MNGYQKAVAILGITVVVLLVVTGILIGRCVAQSRGSQDYRDLRERAERMERIAADGANTNRELREQLAVSEEEARFLRANNEEAARLVERAEIRNSELEILNREQRAELGQLTDLIRSYERELGLAGEAVGSVADAIDRAIESAEEAPDESMD
jgi:SMC interacting uncharacterized protein involved in chromosome segregation